MRPILKYGVPAAAGLATGGYALSQGEDPGSAGLAALTGGLGGAAGLLGARALAGKYNPGLLMQMQKGLANAENAAIDYAMRSREGGFRQGAGNIAADVTRGINKAAFGTGLTKAGIPFPTRNVQRNLGKGLAVGLVPTAALTAGLGGVALGGAIEATGLPGFQQGIVDPEAYQSSNMIGARQGIPTLQYPG